MNTITQYLSEYVSEAFRLLGYEQVGNVISSNRPDLCQFQCDDAFKIAKTHKKNPMLVAEEVLPFLQRNSSIFKSVEVSKPGFINMILTDDFLSKFCLNMFHDNDFGLPKNNKSETIVIDYGGPNIAKPLHIGHLRSAIIGESLKRMFKYYGCNVISDVHLGDWGLQMGLVIAEYQARHPNWACFSNKNEPPIPNIPDIDVNELNEIYPLASEKSKKNDEFLNNAKKITFDLQNGHTGYTELWKKIRQASVFDLTKVYKKLSVDFDYWYGESDSQKYINQLLQTLSEKDLLYKSDGALVVYVSNNSDKKTIPPVLIKKSDSSNLYATTDLATIIQRNKDFNPDKILYVVDARQDLHFEQVFRCARKADLVSENTELEFLGFGTINGSDGKPYKTREGGVMRLETFIESVRLATFTQIEKSNYITNISNEEKDELSLKIAIAAIKFGDLINHYSKNYIFDSDKFLSFEGKTGTYLLYTISRINSLLKKTGFDVTKSISITCSTNEERNLVLNLINTGDVFQSAINNKAPNIICEHAYVVASSFSKLYQSCNIIKETDSKKKQELINLFAIAKKFLILYLDILGIEPVEYM